MRETRKLTCITCPMGCPLTAVLEDGKVIEVTGNTCPRGKRYAEDECTHPTRVLTTTVKVDGGKEALVSAKSASPLPKELLFAAMEEIKTLAVPAPVTAGDVLQADLCGTGIPLVATKTVGCI